MPKAYSGDLRVRVIEMVQAGASRREAAEEFSVAGSTAVKWLQRWEESGSAEAKPRGGSISPLEVHATVILEVVRAQPDAAFVELLVVLKKRGIRTSRSALWRFFGRHGITFKKNGSARMWYAPAANGFASKACLIQPGWYSSMKPA